MPNGEKPRVARGGKPPRTMAGVEGIRLRPNELSGSGGRQEDAAERFAEQPWRERSLDPTEVVRSPTPDGHDG